MNKSTKITMYFLAVFEAGKFKTSVEIICQGRVAALAEVFEDTVRTCNKIGGAGGLVT